MLHISRCVVTKQRQSDHVQSLVLFNRELFAKAAGDIKLPQMTPLKVTDQNLEDKDDR